MNKYLRTYLAGLAGLSLHLSGVVEKAHRRIEKSLVLPIYFHNPRKDLFEKVVVWLKKNDFTFISTQEMIRILKGQKDPRKKLVWITFDDGWQANINNVIPTIIHYNIPVSFFISTYPVEKSGFFWWTQIIRNKNKLPAKYRADTSKIWHLSWQELYAIIKDLDGNDKGFVREAMTVQEVREISKLPQVTIGSHGVHHLILTHCTEKDLISEIAQSKLALEDWTGKTVNYFCYPKGFYGKREISILEHYGYDLAATIENSVITQDTDLYVVPRHAVLDDGFFFETICHVLGIWQPIRNKWLKKNRLKL
jgi:peptidoglycan/xylan/chitin deacetylase (PgdA/CDA1 family)